MTIPQPAFYMFKCEQSSPPGMPKPSCVNNETKDLYGHLGMKLMEKGLIATVVPVRTACLNRCQQGPVMLVEPGHYMYVNNKKKKIDRIIDEHIIGEKPVEEYLIDEEFWGKPMTPEEAMKMVGR